MATFKEFANVARTTAADKTSRVRLDEILHVLKKNEAYKEMTPDKAVRILEELGPTFVKLGQIMSDRSDIVPEKYCQAFATLRDDATPIAFNEVLAIMNAAYAPRSTSEVFSHIDPTPLGSASIAQVHEAMLPNGTKVAVKVRRPGIREMMIQDAVLMRHLIAVAQLVTHKYAHELTSAAGFVEEVSKSAEQETDFTHELANLERFYPEAQAVPGVSSPKAFPELSSESVLVMEYVDGDELASVCKKGNEQGYNLDAIARRIAQSYISQFIDYGFFTSDPHMGNIILREAEGRDHSRGAKSIPIASANIDADMAGQNIGAGITIGTSSEPMRGKYVEPEIVWIDMGMMGELTSIERHLVSQVFLAVARNDAFLLAKSMEALTTRTGESDSGALLEMLSLVLSKYRSADLADINIGNVMTEVLSVLSDQNLVVNPSVTMLVRGIVVMEGVLSEISPSTSIIEIVSEHVMRAETEPEKLAMHARNLAGNLIGSADAASKLPAQLSNTLEMLDMGEIGVTGKLDVSDKTLSTIYASVSRLCLALLSVGLFLGSSILCTTDMAPKLLGVPLLGVAGFVGAAVLGIYLLTRIVKSRHAMANHEDPTN